MEKLYVNVNECECESHSVVSDSLQPHGLYSPWNSPGQKPRVGSLSLLQGIFPTQGSNPGLMTPALTGGFLTIFIPYSFTILWIHNHSRC